MDFEKYLIPAQEEYLFNQEPLYLNFDKWLQNENRVLWITGISGGGKGFIAKKTAKENEKSGKITIVELDKFENYPWYYQKKEDEPHVAKGDQIIFDYLKKTFGDLSIDIWVDRPEKYQQDMGDFIRYLMVYIDDHPEEKFIVEGIQIFADRIFEEMITKESSVIVIKTAKIFSMAKVMHREHNQIRNCLHQNQDPQGKLAALVKRLTN